MGLPRTLLRSPFSNGRDHVGEDSPPISPRAVSRLVDGELDAHDRRRVLERCDEHREGWRQIAMAFLEEQSIREALRSFVAAPCEPERVNQPEPTTTPSPRPPRGGFLPRSPMGIAAGIVLCLGIGTLIGWVTALERHRPKTHTAEFTNVEPKQKPKIKEDLIPGKVIVQEIEPPPFAKTMKVPHVASIGDGPKTGDKNEYVKFAVLRSGDENPTTVSVPLIQGKPDEQIHTAMMGLLKARLRRDGVAIPSSVRFVHLSLSDGRQVIVPIESIQFGGVGLQDFD